VSSISCANCASVKCCKSSARKTPRAGPSYLPEQHGFQPDERAVTIKKIDEIEAQMSQPVVEEQAGG
jgi:hypothetical protein